MEGGTHAPTENTSLELLPSKQPYNMNAAKLINLKNLARMGGVPSMNPLPEEALQAQLSDVEKYVSGSHVLTSAKDV